MIHFFSTYLLYESLTFAASFCLTIIVIIWQSWERVHAQIPMELLLNRLWMKQWQNQGCLESAAVAHALDIPTATILQA